MRVKQQNAMAALVNENEQGKYFNMRMHAQTDIAACTPFNDNHHAAHLAKKVDVDEAHSHKIC